MFSIGSKRINYKNVSIQIPSIMIRYSTTSSQWVAEVTQPTLNDILAMEATLLRLLEVLWAKGLITKTTKTNILKETL